MARNDLETETLIAHTLRADGFDASEDGTGRGTPLVAVPFTLTRGGPILRGLTAEQTEISVCLDTSINPGCNQGGTVVVQPYNIIGLGQQGSNHAYPTETSGCFQHKGLAASGNEAGTLIHVEAIAFTSKDHGQDAGDLSPTLRAMAGEHANSGGQVAVAFQERGREGGRSVDFQEDLAYSLNAPAGGGRRHELNIQHRSAVRRLTPRECERLQGFPDSWTDVPYRGKPSADGPRYKALGNSFAVPVVKWIGQRIQIVDAFLEAEGDR